MSQQQLDYNEHENYFPPLSPFLNKVFEQCVHAYVLTPNEGLQKGTAQPMFLHRRHFTSYGFTAL